MLILGYDSRAHTDMYRLYVFDMGQKPDTIMQYIRHWRMASPSTPEGCLDIAAKMASPRYAEINTDHCVKLIDSFIDRIHIS